MLILYTAYPGKGLSTVSIWQFPAAGKKCTQNTGITEITLGRQGAGSQFTYSMTAHSVSGLHNVVVRRLILMQNQQAELCRSSPKIGTAATRYLVLYCTVPVLDTLLTESAAPILELVAGQHVKARPHDLHRVEGQLVHQASRHSMHHLHG